MKGEQSYGQERLTEEGRARIRARVAMRGRRIGLDLGRRSYQDRPFIGWDGEGITHPDGSHDYVLFGNSLNHSIINESCPTKDIFDFIAHTEQVNPNTFHVIFSGKYDVNMWLKDCHYKTLEELHHTGHARYKGYIMQYAQGKFFRLTKKDMSVTIYDVWSFFGTSFVTACRQYLGNDEILDQIEKDKKNRNKFRWEDLPHIRTYMGHELDYLVKLMNTLRDHLTTAEIPLSQWHGPGAIASMTMRQKGVKVHMQDTPREVLPYVQHAYAGGWAEQFKAGLYLGEVHQYDRNSAYPAEIATLPSMAGSVWTHERVPGRIDRLGLYHLKAKTPFSANRDAQPYPLFWRGEHSEVYMPPRLEGWYWGVEVAGVLADPLAYGQVDVTEGWILHPRDEGLRPFDYIHELYEQRRQWKVEGNPAHMVLKLDYNSHYGKHAQRIGYTKRGAPTWHQLEWAGLTTAGNRAAIYQACLLGRGAIISIATDAVFSTVPLNLPVSGKLGEWEYTHSIGILQLQSGFYWLRHSPGKCKDPTSCEDGWHAKYRGFNKDTVRIEHAYRYLEDIDRLGVKHPPFGVGFPSTRFMTWGQTHGGPNWRTWRTTDRVLNFHQLSGKRVHNATHCDACQAGLGYTDTLHRFHSQPDPRVGGSMSVRHYLPWQADYDPNLPPDEGIDL